MNTQTLIKVSAVLLLCISALFALFSLSNAVAEDYVAYQKEGKCIALLIKLNVPRKDIITDNGTCYRRQTNVNERS